MVKNRENAQYGKMPKRPANPVSFSGERERESAKRERTKVKGERVTNKMGAPL